ncbi:MAG: SpoIIE family protein phosphatase [Spirochaetes bacterium]|nr:SpoIIE family protein phosphatase [Spirochaetota bacterium]
MKVKLLIIFYLLNFTFLFSQNVFYWERQQVLYPQNSGKFETVSNDKILLTAFVNTADKFNLYFKYTTDSYNWSDNILLVKNFFSNTILGDDFSIGIDSDNNLYYCYRKNSYTFEIEKLTYPYYQNKREKIAEITSQLYIYLPKIHVTSRGEIILLYTTNEGNNFFIEYKKINKSGNIIAQMRIGDRYKSSLNPVFMEKNDVFYITFQAKETAVQEGYFFNIYAAVSNDSGRTWGYSRLVTSKGENNQGPCLLNEGKKQHLVWEKEDEKLRAHIYYKSLDSDFKNESKEILVSSISSEAHSPNIQLINNVLNVFWYDDKSGVFQNYYAQILENNVFNESPVLKNQGRTLRNQTILFKDQIKVFWLEIINNINRLIYLQTDTFVNAPEPKIAESNRLNIFKNRNISFQWNIVNDISGIKGYNILLTKDKNASIKNNPQFLNYYEISKSFNNLSDGTWYFKISAVDNASNESPVKEISFTIDTKAPSPPLFVDQKLNSEGGLTTNSPKIEWTESNEKFNNFYYTYKLFPDRMSFEINSFKRRVSDRDFTITNDKSLSLANLDNGILLIGIKGDDLAGNTSEVNWQEYKLNNYVTVTYINNVRTKLLPTGEKVFEILGRGFKIDGNIKNILLDKNRTSPYDNIISSDDFNVLSDTQIVLKREIIAEDGIYYLGVEHPLRGYSFYKNPLEFSGEWVFKNVKPNFLSFDRVVFLSGKINFTMIIFIIAGIIWVFLILIILFSIISTIKEKVKIKLLLEHLEEIKERLSDQEYLKRREKMTKKGIGLTIKYTILIIALVITIVVATSFTLSYRSLSNETKVLARETKERANLIMINYETLIKDVYIFQQGLPRAIDITENISKLPDLGFVMFKEVDSPESYIRYGEREKVFFNKVNYESIANYNYEKNKIINETVFNETIKKDIEAIKTDYEGEAKIYPEFNPSKINENYIFFKPIIIKDAGENDKPAIYAYIIIGYSFERIIEEIKIERIKTVQLALIVTLIAILISIFGAIILASTTIKPIKKMSKHVNIISTTDDYEKLLGTENEKIEVKTRDEIGILASSINEMTAKLIEKAKADKQMILGKEIQKKFISLEPHQTDYIDIYGFYEGAKGVSGDYFNYKKLDDDHYAFIICDVAGKAVPAALIMVQISTIFDSYFTNFNPKSRKLETVSIVNIINDTVAEREFTGRFAAILVIILNIKTGKALLTNAGYTQMLVYRNLKKEAEWLKLNSDSGAAGIFPASMLPHPYVQEEIKINKGDIIYLFTDGIEESRNGKTVKTENGEEKPEEFSLERVKKILDKSYSKTPKEVIEDLIDAEKLFRGENEQYDDLTILGIMRK